MRMLWNTQYILSFLGNKNLQSKQKFLKCKRFTRILFFVPIWFILRITCCVSSTDFAPILRRWVVTESVSRHGALSAACAPWTPSTPNTINCIICIENIDPIQLWQTKILFNLRHEFVKMPFNFDVSMYTSAVPTWCPSPWVQCNWKNRKTIFSHATCGYC